MGYYHVRRWGVTGSKSDSPIISPWSVFSGYILSPRKKLSAVTDSRELYLLSYSQLKCFRIE
jgi:hypothetical protein